jgi:hypothetical protein
VNDLSCHKITCSIVTVVVTLYVTGISGRHGPRRCRTASGSATLPRLPAVTALLALTEWAAGAAAGALAWTSKHTVVVLLYFRMEQPMRQLELQQ